MKEVKKLKIAYVIPRFHPFKGGAELNMLEMASRSAKLGHDVTVLTTNVKFRNETPLKFEEYEGVKIIRHWALNDWLYLGFYPELFTHLLKNEYDVIHTSGIGFLWREFCLICSKFKKNKTAKFITTPHGPFMALGDTSGFRGFSRKFYTFILKQFINKLYDYVIAVNPKQHTWMESDYNIDPSKIVIIPNGIDKNYIEKSLYEEKYDESVVLSFTGRLERYKGPHQVIKALGKIKRSKGDFPNFEFWIMGRPSTSGYKEYINELVVKEGLEKEVRFIYSPSDEERDEALYKHSEIFILASKWEATGIVLIEAMAKGNAVVTTHQNEVADLIIEQGVNGYIFENENIEELAKYLKNLLLDQNLRKEMAKLNLAKSKDLTWDSVYEFYEKLLTDISNG